MNLYLLPGIEMFVTKNNKANQRSNVLSLTDSSIEDSFLSPNSPLFLPLTSLSINPLINKDVMNNTILSASKYILSMKYPQ